MKDIVIIGCGITGSLIAHELSKYQLDVAVLEKNNEAAIYPPKAALQKSKIIISRARVVLKELTELGITKNISGDVIVEGDSKKLIFKF